MNDSERIAFLEKALSQCLYTKRLMIESNHFWDRFTDNLIIAFSFLCLGILIGIFIINKLLQKKVVIDYDLPKGQIIRVFHGDKKWFVMRIDGVLHLLDILVLCLWDKGSDKYIDKHDKKRIRKIAITVLAIIFVLILSGTLEILNAFAWDMNPFNYIKMYLVK